MQKKKTRAATSTAKKKTGVASKKIAAKAKKPVAKKTKMNTSDMSPNEKLKYEIAAELGLLTKVNNRGWKALTPKETGSIGGHMAKRMRDMRNKKVTPKVAAKKRVTTAAKKMATKRTTAATTRAKSRTKKK